jgi:uncharacterized protein (TIGR02246 family)
MRVQAAFWQALRTKDAALFATIIATDFVGRSPGEADQSREAFIATLTAFPVRVAEIGGEGIAVHVFGEMAVLTGVQVARLELPDGTARASRVMLSIVFCRRDRHWLMVLSHSCEQICEL